MEETRELKRQGFIGYQLEDDVYSMVDFETDEVLDTMNEVSVLFDENVLLKHGNPERVDWRSRYLRKVYAQCGIKSNIHIITGKIPIDELDKMLTIVGYLPNPSSRLRFT